MALPMARGLPWAPPERVRPAEARVPGDILQQRGDAARIERAAEVEIGLRPRRAGQSDHALAGSVQPQPAHRSIHAVHVDDDMVGIGFRAQLPGIPERRVRLLERRGQRRLGGRVHAGKPERQRHDVIPEGKPRV
jgi:hypothetical protein